MLKLRSCKLTKIELDLASDGDEILSIAAEVIDLDFPGLNASLGGVELEILRKEPHPSRMQTTHSPLDPDLWLHNIFATKQVQQGAVIRRKARDVERFCGMQRFMEEIDRRGYQVVENGGQFVIFCNAEPIRLLTRHPH